MRKILLVLLVLVFGWYWTKFCIDVGWWHGTEFVFKGECEQFLEENPTGGCGWEQQQKWREAFKHTFLTFP